MIEENLVPQPERPVTHRATLAGETVDFNVDDFQTVLDELVARHPGRGAPDVVSFADLAKNERKRLQAEAARSAAPKTQTSKWRALSDEALARERGFEPRPPVVTLGDSIGDEMPRSREVAAELRDRVLAECRADLEPLFLADTRLTESGSLATGRTIDSQFEVSAKYGLEPDVFKQMATKMLPARLAAGYLLDCPPKLRGVNWGHWARQDARSTPHVLRTRRGGETGRVVFACVTPDYTSVDADVLADVLSRELPDGARGLGHYDGYRWRIEAFSHLNLVDGRFVSGETFKAGIVVSSTDNGSGSLRIQPVVLRNLSRTMLFVDGAVTLRHFGGAEKIGNAVRTVWESASKNALPFIRSWEDARYQRDERLSEKMQGTTDVQLRALASDEILAGAFTGILKQGLVDIPGRTADLVPKLIELHGLDEARRQYGVSRASIALAFVRYASFVEANPFTADDIRDAVATLISSSKPIPYEKPYRLEEPSID